MSEYEGKYDRRLLTRCRELEAESFALAANQCHHGYAGEHGHHRCRYQDRIAELEAKNKRLHKALELARETVADEVQHLINTYGNCSLTRCVRAELAEIDAALAGHKEVSDG